MQLTFSEVFHEVSHLFAELDWEELFGWLWGFFLLITWEGESLISLVFLLFVSEDGFEYWMFGVFDDIFNLISEQIFVLFPESKYRVIDFFGGMLDSEKGGWKVKIGGWKMFLFFMIVSEFGDKGRLIWRGNWAPFIEEIEDT